MKYKKATLKASKPFREIFGSYYMASGKKYQIVYCTDLSSSDGHRAHGLTCAKDHKIYLNITEPDEVLATWAHECLHAESFSRELFTQSWYDTDTEEHYANICGRVVEFLMQKAVAKDGKRKKR